MKNKARGFSLVEMLVVVSIIAIFASVAYVNYYASIEQSRDIERQSDLRALQTAVELYKLRHGEYPIGCNDDGDWSGDPNSWNNCDDGSYDYIVGLAPEFIPTLPFDPGEVINDNGYSYVVNSEHTVYKIIAKNSVESEVVDYNHGMKSCAVNGADNICDLIGDSNDPTPLHCQEDSDQFRTSYAVWGGYADSSEVRGDPDYENSVEWNTEDIICKE